MKEIKKRMGKRLRERKKKRRFSLVTLIEDYIWFSFIKKIKNKRTQRTRKKRKKEEEKRFNSYLIILFFNMFWNCTAIVQIINIKKDYFKIV